MLSDRRDKVPLGIGRMAALVPTKLMLEFHQTLLYPSMVFLVGAYGLGVEEVSEGCDDLVVELRELQRLVNVHVVDATTSAHRRRRGHPIGGRGVGRGILWRPRRREGQRLKLGRFCRHGRSKGDFQSNASLQSLFLS